MYVYLLFCTGFTFFQFVQQQQQSVCYLHEVLGVVKSECCLYRLFTSAKIVVLFMKTSNTVVCSLLFSTHRSGGLLIGQLDKVSFFERQSDSQHRLHLLPLEGTLTSLCVEEQTRHLLASYRPTSKHGSIRHQLCEMLSRNISSDPTVIDNVCSCNVIHTFHGGRTQTVLSKTIVTRHPADPNRLLVCAGDESNNSVCMNLVTH